MPMMGFSTPNISRSDLNRRLSSLSLHSAVMIHSLPSL